MTPDAPHGGVGLILVAAGLGTRLGAGRPKALVPLGRGPHASPVVVHALRGALRCGALSHVVVVAPPDPEGMEQLTAAVRSVPVPAGVEVSVVAGGAERTDSVRNGLRGLPAEVGVVLVHDAARALTPVEVFDRVVHAVHAGHPAVTPALPLADTVKQVVADAAGVEHVVATLDRAALRAVQTPQGFLRETLERAHAEAARTGAAPVTDDCGLVEAHGGRVTVVEGSPRALKITTPHDLDVAARWLDEDGEGRAPVLVVLSGLPGVGKTTVARSLCRRLRAAHLRVDTLEQGLLRGGLTEGDLGPHGYTATYAVARDQLALGLPVVADMVNGIALVRAAWDEVGAGTGARVVRVLLECPDREVHRRRVEERVADIQGHRLPAWSGVRERELEPWPEADLVLDTGSLAVEDVVDRIVAVLEESA